MSKQSSRDSSMRLFADRKHIKIFINGKIFWRKSDGLL